MHAHTYAHTWVTLYSSEQDEFEVCAHALERVCVCEREREREREILWGEECVFELLSSLPSPPSVCTRMCSIFFKQGKF